MQFCDWLLLAILLKTKRADIALQVCSQFYSWEVGQKGLVELLYMSFEVPEDKDEIFSPKHDVIAPDVKHEAQKVGIIINKIQHLGLVDWKSLQTCDERIQSQVGVVLVLLHRVEVDQNCESCDCEVDLENDDNDEQHERLPSAAVNQHPPLVELNVRQREDDEKRNKQQND